MLPCANKTLFGVDCMGCGTQRAFALLIEGDFIGAFKMFPAIYTTLLLFVFLGLHFVDKNRKYNFFILVTAIINAVIMIVSFGIKHL